MKGHGEEEEEEEEEKMTTKKGDPTVAKLSTTGCMLKTKKRGKFGWKLLMYIHKHD